MSTNVFAFKVVEKHLTKDQYIKWKKNVSKFIYANTVVCLDHKEAVRIYNMYLANENHALNIALHNNNSECYIERQFHPLSIESTYPNKVVNVAWLDFSSTGIDTKTGKTTHEYKLIVRLIYTCSIHDKKELKGRFIK